MTKLTGWIRKNLTGILIGAAVATFIYEGLISKAHSFWATRILWLIAMMVSAGGKPKAETGIDLKKRGLTVEDLHNISFVKTWEPLREDGKWKYIIDGGIIYAFAFAPLFLLASAVFYGGSFFYEGPGKVFATIGYSIGAGAMAGMALNKLKWHKNEARFMRLTQPTEKDLLNF